jgi:hypothetical protein
VLSEEALSLAPPPPQLHPCMYTKYS